MRRIAMTASLLAVLACSTPRIFLTPAYEIGQRRVYSLVARSSSATEVGDAVERHREELRARSTIEVLSAAGSETRLRVTLTPLETIVDGDEGTPPPEQVAEIVVDRAGTLVRIESVGGLPPEVSGARIEDIAPLLGASLPSDEMRIGSRWHRRVPIEGDAGGATSEQRGRIEALRREHDYDCAIVSLGTQRPIARDRDSGGAVVRFTGVEYSTVELAFAFRPGFPVRIETDAEARLSVTGGGSGGTLTVVSHAVLDLESVG